MDIEKYLESEKKRIDRALGQHLPQSGPPVIIEAMRYCLEAGGKRLRPILTVATAATLGSTERNILDLACAVEYVHTYSLIHDDLPSMDNSDMRRGKPSCHCAYGEAIAVLAGDALLTMAFEIVGKFGRQAGQEKQAAQIMVELAVAAGVTGMIGGQVLDLEAEGKEPSLDDVIRIAELKTGALLKAAVLCGAIAADASEQELRSLTNYAASIGLAFQIVDDLLDYENSAEKLGKPVGADQKRAKATYPALLGQKEARRRAELIYNNSLSALEQLNCPTAILGGIAKKMVFRSR